MGYRRTHPTGCVRRGGLVSHEPMILARILVLVLTFAGGLAIIRYAEPIVRTFGYMDWAEKHLGSGGTYSAWKLIGILVMVFGFLYAIGQFDLAPQGTAPFLGNAS